MQEGRVISYEYRKAKEYEQKYSTYDLELTIVIHSALFDGKEITPND